VHDGSSHSGKKPRSDPKGLGIPRSILSGYGLRDFYFRNISKSFYTRLAWRAPRQDLFELNFFERVLARRPEHGGALEALGHLYTRLGEHQKGLAVDRRLVRLRPERPLAHYNLACSLSLTGQQDEALAELALAVRLGYRDLDHLERDPDLQALRADPRYGAFLAMVKSAVAAR
jgi:tetratricopeptide (TPR) repeat protein